MGKMSRNFRIFHAGGLFLSLALVGCNATEVSSEGRQAANFQTGPNAPGSPAPSASPGATATPSPSASPGATATPGPSPSASPSPSVSPSPSASPGASPGPGTGDCLKYNYTLFPWANSTQDATSTAPVLGANKIDTLRIYEGSHPSAPSSGPGWFLNAYLTPSGTTTNTTMVIDKVGEDEGDVMTCFFGPTDGADGTAKISFVNIGSGLMTGFIGFISAGAPEKYIACRFTSTAGKVARFASADGRQRELGSDQPFVIKRGCFQ